MEHKVKNSISEEGEHGTQVGNGGWRIKRGVRVIRNTMCCFSPCVISPDSVFAAIFLTALCV